MNDVWHFILVNMHNNKSVTDEQFHMNLANRYVTQTSRYYQHKIQSSRQLTINYGQSTNCKPDACEMALFIFIFCQRGQLLEISWKDWIYLLTIVIVCFFFKRHKSWQMKLKFVGNLIDAVFGEYCCCNGT